MAWMGDVAVGTVAIALHAAAAAVRAARPRLDPLARVALRPPILPQSLHPGRWLDRVEDRGRETRVSTDRDLARLLDLLVPAVLEEVLRRVDLTAVVMRHVDLDRVVAGVDLDAAAGRLDVNEVVRRVDLNSAAQQLDLDAVAGRLDLEAVLDRIDLTEVVLKRVDLDALVQAILDRIDLVGLAEGVIDEVDLPDIIRESTGSMASDTVRGARMQAIAADETVGRLMERLSLRRGRSPGGAGPADGVSDNGPSQDVPSREPGAN